LSVDDGSPPLRFKVQLIAIALSATARLHCLSGIQARTAIRGVCARPLSPLGQLRLAPGVHKTSPPSLEATSLAATNK